MSKRKATSREFVDSPVVIDVTTKTTIGAWVRRILVWVIATQAITGSVSMRLDAGFKGGFNLEFRFAGETKEMRNNATPQKADPTQVMKRPQFKRRATER